MNVTAKAPIFSADFHPFKVEYSDSTVINLLRQGSEKVFESIFKDYFKSLHAYAYTFLKDDELAEEVVQNVFCRIWEKRENLKTDGSLKAYLYRAVHNESLNYLKHQKVKASFQVYYADHMEQAEGNQGYASNGGTGGPEHIAFGNSRSSLPATESDPRYV